ncbi:MAG: 30S ribosomal protein S8e [Candidatus Woesearchaeota archaeon]
MVLNQARSNRQPSGARYKYQKVRRQHEIGRRPALTRIGKKRNQVVRTIGNNKKVKALTAQTASVFNPKTKKHVTADIESVLENQANRHFVRRNIITKGTVIQTSKGAARVTSRPGQTGQIQAVLIA